MSLVFILVIELFIEIVFPVFILVIELFIEFVVFFEFAFFFEFILFFIQMECLVRVNCLREERGSVASDCQACARRMMVQYASWSLYASSKRNLVPNVANTWGCI